jgi:hypothetical protein
MVTSLIGTVQNLLPEILSSNPGFNLSDKRSQNIKKEMQSNQDAQPVTPSFDTGSAADWRVRLSLPSSSMWKSSLFTPLKEAGGLIFPYTPTITISHQANYQEQPITHQNYQFVAYQYSRVSEIQIVGDFIVENALQAQYWISTIHYLRSVTKMYTGEDQEAAGNPPPIVLFNAYGDYVFKNIPVVVKSFNLTLPKEVDYITTNMQSLPKPKTVAGSMASQLLGQPSTPGSTKIQSFSGSVQPESKSGPDDSHVPTQSAISVTLLPVYSRTRVRQFSLAKFVEGKYVKDGYL